MIKNKKRWGICSAIVIAAILATGCREKKTQESAGVIVGTSGSEATVTGKMTTAPTSASTSVPSTTAQAVTEGNKKPDFMFPSEEAYHDMTFAVEKLCTLAAKTTCKDRWRQILNEADRLRDENKYLCTMQQGISAAQMDEMQPKKVFSLFLKPITQHIRKKSVTASGLLESL